MKSNNIVLIIISLVTLLVLIIGATYAYFATGNLNITNVANINTVTERNNMVFDTLGGGMSLNITTANMVEAEQGNVAAENNTTLTVNFTANTDYSMVCTYDIIYEWTSTDKYTAHTSGITENEFTIQANLASNAHVFEGVNAIYLETDLSLLTFTNGSTTVVSGAQIDGTGSTTSTAVWALTSNFYNGEVDQSALSGKTFAGKFKVDNVSCVAGTVTPDGPTGYWYVRDGIFHTFPSYGGSSLKTNGSDTGSNVYIGQNATKYYACANNGTHEICLSQPFNQYGLTDHKSSDFFTNDEAQSGVNALIAAFNVAGFNITSSDCHSNNNMIRCYISENIYCGIYYQGTVFCTDDQSMNLCTVDQYRSAKSFSSEPM